MWPQFWPLIGQHMILILASYWPARGTDPAPSSLWGALPCWCAGNLQGNLWALSAFVNINDTYKVMIYVLIWSPLTLIADDISVWHNTHQWMELIRAQNCLNTDESESHWWWFWDWWIIFLFLKELNICRSNTQRWIFQFANFLAATKWGLLCKTVWLKCRISGEMYSSLCKNIAQTNWAPGGRNH